MTCYWCLMAERVERRRRRKHDRIAALEYALMSGDFPGRQLIVGVWAERVREYLVRGRANQ